MKIFSRRYKTPIESGQLMVELSARLRGRVWKEMQEINETIRKTTDGGWNYDSSVLDEAEHTIKRLYGVDEFDVWLKSSVQGTSSELKDLVCSGCYHYQILDVIEICFGELWDSKRYTFQHAVNLAMEDERCPWRLSDGYFFKVDSEFLEQHIFSTAHLMLGDDGFKGALEEFDDARADLTAGDHKDAILKACKSLESVMKVILTARGKDFSPTAAAKVLLNNLSESGFFGDIPIEGRNVITGQVVLCLPSLRNKLAGHGQGGIVVNIPQSYASLSIKLAAVLNTFLIEHHQETQEIGSPDTTEDNALDQDDDIPF
ncbi:MAG: AbiJ-NTD4 domain-containing protein [Bdellovibrionales bacterium]